MIRYPLLLLSLLVTVFATAAPTPLYIVNGKITADISSIAPEDIELIETLPADEQTIARYGQQASNGVLLITLRYDFPAAFPADSSFSSYIARQVKWPSSEPAARVVVRYTITPEGVAIIDKELQSTDSRFKRRVMKAFAQAPRWQPATKNGTAVASEGVLSIQLPEGKPLPRKVELVYR